MAKHLSNKMLSAWLDGSIDLDHEHDEHLNSCTRCAGRLEKLERAFADVEPLKEQFRPALLEVLRPPEDLHERISARIAIRLQQRDDTALFGSMLGVPIETAQLLTQQLDES